MTLEEALLALGLLIVLAKLLEGIFRRFGLNAIIAYAMAGVLLGPILGIVEPDPEIELILSIGIFMFFFLIGIDELDIKGFIASARGRIFAAATLSVGISLLVCLAITTDVLFDLGLDLDFETALGLAGILSLSSLGLVAKVLADEDRLKDPAGVQMFTAVVIAELLGLFVVAFAISEHFYAATHSEEEAEGVVIALVIIGQILGFAVLTWLFSTMLLPRIIWALQRFLRVPQLSFGLLLGGLLLVVVGAERVGLHGSLGALLFGAALSMLPYQIRRDIMPGIRSSAEGFFVPLFFASAGLYLSLDFLDLPMLTVVALIVVPLVGKLAGAFFSAFMLRLDAPVTVAAALMAKGVAEIALLLLLLQTGGIDKGIFSLLVVVMFGYMLLSPFGISFSLKRQEESEQPTDARRLPPSMVPFALEGIRVGDILDRSRMYAHHSTAVSDFMENWLLPEQFDYVIIGERQRPGIVSLSMMRYVPRGEWGETPLSRVERQNTPSAGVDTLIEDALQLMIDNALTVLPVVDEATGRFIGSISSSEVHELITHSHRRH